jgi:hypothetical protein
MFHSSLLGAAADGVAMAAAVSGGMPPLTPSAASEARSFALAARADIERVLMITEALWQILKEKHGYTDAELFRRITEIDLRDGRADGRVAPSPPRRCPHCDRVMVKHRPVCIFCGMPSMVDPFER